MKRVSTWFLFLAWVIIILLLWSIVACNRPPPKLKRYQLENGRVVECTIHQADSCGYYLANCTDGIVYRCQQNVWELAQ